MKKCRLPFQGQTISSILANRLPGQYNLETTLILRLEGTVFSAGKPDAGAKKNFWMNWRMKAIKHVVQKRP